MARSRITRPDCVTETSSLDSVGGLVERIGHGSPVFGLRSIAGYHSPDEIPRPFGVSAAPLWGVSIHLTSCGGQPPSQRFHLTCLTTPHGSRKV